MTKPTCDRCSAPAVHHEIDGALLCDRHKAEEMRIREYAKVAVSNDPADLILGPNSGIPEAMERLGWKPKR